MLPTPVTRRLFGLACLLILLFAVNGCDQQPGKGDPAKETALDHAAKHLDPVYICPMHAHIVQNNPGSCPVCGMDLEQRKPPAAKPDTTVQLSPDVVQKLGVRTARVEEGKLWKFIKTVGYVTYNERRTSVVTTRTYGWIENLGVRTVGREVKKGQLLLELYSPDFLETQKEFIAAQKKDQSGTLKKYGARQESVPSRDYLRYLEISESMANEIARTGKPKHRIPIYAPQHGVIIRHEVKKHQFVEPDYPLFVIADLTSVWVEADVYEHQLDWIKPGLPTEIEVQALPGRRFQGQLTYIYPELDPKTRTLKVRLLVNNPDLKLKPNMFAQVRILGGPKEKALKIPREALIVTGERESVIRVLGNGKFKPVDVVTGMRSRGEVEIIKGLKKGDRIVVSGQFLIDSEANLQASFRRFGSNQGK
ncbi:MAG: efflux RND transporter periplasmic adaptor subunit [Gammaproteobacteria bacterium]|nr:efflux RND transporter periplasmic adaptor subunit [Gammaproteobacteria bacterium]MDH5650287.1 efflux RND transporter periplasmic adaptor subunit [Gammaproteobacteria bacterium]